MHREFRKPLIVAAPKRLLRLKQATSNIDEFSSGTLFERLISETDTEIKDSPDSVKKLILCSGQIYYDLVAEREKVSTGH